MACDFYKLPHEGIQTLDPYVPGKPAVLLAQELGLTNIIQLASNENQLGCSRRVTEALASLPAHRIANYPIASIHPFRDQLTEQLGIPKDMLILGNGSDALFSLILTCFALHPGKKIMLHAYAFISYAVQAKALGIPIVTTPLRSDWSVDVDLMIQTCHSDTALIFLANPNNPTGLLVSFQDVQRLLEHIPSTTLLVLDEAYFEYVARDHQQHSIPLLKHHPNLVITRTFSKAYGLAGLRLGYAMAHPDIIDILHRVLPPFTVNLAALIAAQAAFEDIEFLQRTVQMNQNGLEQMQQGLDDLNIPYLPSSGNFILMDCQQDSLPIYNALQKHGIIVRPLQPYGLNQHLRVTLGTREQNERFLATLPLCLNSISID